MKMRRLLLAWLCLASLSAFAADKLPAPPAVGELPPQLLGKNRNGDPVDLADYRGKVTIVTFWASWCGPCRRELPVLGHFQNAVGRDALEVIAVNFKEPREDYRAVVRANKNIDLTYVHDMHGSVSDQYGVNSLPHMFILDHDGKVAYTHRGYSEESIPGIVEEILSLLPEDVKRRPSPMQSQANKPRSGFAVTQPDRRALRIVEQADLDAAAAADHGAVLHLRNQPGVAHHEGHAHAGREPAQHGRVQALEIRFAQGLFAVHAVDHQQAIHVAAFDFGQHPAPARDRAFQGAADATNFHLQPVALCSDGHLHRHIDIEHQPSAFSMSLARDSGVSVGA